MEIQEIVSAIASVGFPIVACIGLFYLYDRTIKDIVNALDNVNQTLNNVNTTLDKITAKLEDQTPKATFICPVS
jgi:uncharacterized protein YoxC